MKKMLQMYWRIYLLILQKMLLYLWAGDRKNRQLEGIGHGMDKIWIDFYDWLTHTAVYLDDKLWELTSAVLAGVAIAAVSGFFKLIGTSITAAQARRVERQNEKLEVDLYKKYKELYEELYDRIKKIEQENKKLKEENIKLNRENDRLSNRLNAILKKKNDDEED